MRPVYGLISPLWLAEARVRVSRHVIGRQLGHWASWLDRFDARRKTLPMLTDRMARRSIAAGVIAAILGLSCSNGETGGSPLTNSGGSSATTVTTPNTGGGTAASSGGGSSIQSSSGGVAQSSTSSTAVGDGGTTTGGNMSQGGTTSSSQSRGGQSGTTDSGGSSSRGGQSTSSQGGGSQSGGYMTGGTSAGGTSAAGGSQNRGGNDSATGGAGIGGTNLSGGSSSSGGRQTNGGTSANGGSTTTTTAPTYGGGGATSLCQKYSEYFPIGAAVDNQSYNTHSALLTKHFNSITLENDMKFESLQPTEGNFTYGAADNAVAFATKNNMKVRGHALVWHRQTPAWVFANATRDAVLAKMKTHITNVVTHFKGKVYAWDVVNEAIMDDGKYRTGDEPNADQKSQWHKIVGETYIAEAFKYAAAADPSAKLFYNDYYNYVPARRQAIYNMLKGLLDTGVKVHGVGLQAHLNIQPSTVTTHQGYYQHVSELEEAIKIYASLGLEVQVTEMDVSLYVPGVTYTSDLFYTTTTFTDQLQAKQAERYRDFFTMFRRYQGVITGVTFWGIADDNTWLSEFSSGRKDFPLLFDTNHQAKKSYYAVVDF